MRFEPMKLTAAKELPVVIFHVPERQTQAHLIHTLGRLWLPKLVEIRTILDLEHELEKRHGKTEIIVLLGEEKGKAMRIGKHELWDIMELTDLIPDRLLRRKYLLVPMWEPSIIAVHKFLRQTGANLVTTLSDKVSDRRWAFMAIAVIRTLIKNGALGYATRKFLQSQHMQIAERD